MFTHLGLPNDCSHIALHLWTLARSSHHPRFSLPSIALSYLLSNASLIVSDFQV